MLLSPTLGVVRAGDPPIAGCLGALLVDPAIGKYYALTAAQLIGRRHHDLQAAAQSWTLSQDRALTRLTSSLDQDAASMIAAVPLRTHWVDGDHHAHRTRGRGPLVASPWDLAGDRVSILARSKPIIHARLASFDSAFSMPNPQNRERTTFDNAMELHGQHGEKLLARGDAGSLVVDESGDWLGVIIAAKDNVAFAAPLAVLALSMELIIPSSEDIQRHNALVDQMAAEAQSRLEREADRRAQLEARVARIKTGKLQATSKAELDEGRARAEALFA
jgi:hypothetical protein